MKRKQFRITSTLGHDTIKHAWNASNREIERLAGEIDRAEGVTYTLTASESFKGCAEGSCYAEHVKGSRTWTNDRTGEAVVFCVELVTN